jgi:threonylcarbamoyladenosine tRNA methylthiotransferase CDKAL1
MEKRAYIFNTGCIRRALDMTKIHGYLLTNGWQLVNDISAAEIIIISTCGVIERQETLSLAAIRDITKRRNPAARVFVTGCLAKIDPGKIQAIGNFTLIPTGDLRRFDEALSSTVAFEDVPDANVLTNQGSIFDYVLAYRFLRNSLFLRLFRRLSTSEKFLRSCVFVNQNVNSIKYTLGLTPRKKLLPYYNIRIAHGCLCSCTFCATRFATGKLKSKPVDRIVEEFKNGLREGHKIFQLVNEDTGCYGIDIGTTFPHLLRAILAVEGDYQLILIDFNPQWLVKYYDELLSIFLEHRGKIRELFVSLQSGSDKILKAMGRSYESETVKNMLIDLRERVPEIMLRTTALIGFPGETQEDFEMTKKACQDIAFAEVEIDKYEDRPGTRSSLMKDKVPRKIINRRGKELKRAMESVHLGRKDHTPQVVPSTA